MKRSYNSTNPPPSLPQTSPYQAAYAQPAAAAPPLPPGPPPPAPGAPPAAANPYAHYGYGYDPTQQAQQQQQAQVMAAHPQYPGYGYGQAAAAPATSVAAPYAAAPAPQATAADPNAAVAQQWAAYYAAYAQHASATAAAAGAASPYAAAPAPTAYAQPTPYGAPPPPPPGGSPVGAPPYKRTRYDQPLPPQQQPPLPAGPPPPAPGGYGAAAAMPPGILPPVGGRPSRTGPPPPMGGRGPPPPQQRDPYGGGPQGGMRGGPGPRDMGPPLGPGGMRGGGGGGRGGGGGGYDDRMMGPPGGGGGGGGGGYGMRGAPMGPRGGGGGGGPRGDERFGGRGGPMGAPGGGGRAMSGLPSGPGGGGGNKYGAPSGTAAGGGPRGLGLPNAPRGPKGLPLAPGGGAGGARNSDANRQTPRKERKWGAGAASNSAAQPAPNKRERDKERERDGEGTKRTFTDFRIEGLSIPELGWEWHAERVEREMRKAAEELDRKVREKEEREKEQDAPAADALSDPTAVVKDEEEVDGEPVVAGDDDDAGDMSIDQPPSDLPSLAADGPTPALPADPTAPATIAHGKHRLDEDSGAEPALEAPVEEEGSKAKKVRVDAVSGDAAAEEEVRIEALHPPVEAQAGEGDVVIAEAEQGDEKPAAAPEVEGEPRVEDAAAPHEDAADDEDVDGAPLPPSSQEAPTAPIAPPVEEEEAKPAPRPARENSRLRIYFSSPTAGASSYTLASAAAKAPSSKAGSVPPAAPAAVKREEEGAPAHGGKAEPAPTPASSEELAQPVPAAEVMDKIEEEKEKEAVKPDAPAEDAAPEPAEAPQPNGEAAEEDIDGDPVGDAPAAAEDQPPAPAAPAAGGEGAAPADEQPAAPAEDASEATPVEAAATIDVAAADDAHGPDDEDELLITKVEPDNVPEQADAPPAASDAAQPADSARAPSIAPSVAGTILLPPEPAADRISISYARNTRRMVLDADVIDSVKVFRADGRIELAVRCKPAVIAAGEDQVEDEFRVCRGVLVESLDVEADDYVVMDRAALALAWSASSEEGGTSPDSLLPPLHRLLVAPAPSENGEPATAPSTFSHEVITVSAQLDRQNPLTEARWVKTGEVENWILSLGISSGANPKDMDNLSEWRSKIKIVDPDPPPTIQHALESWAASSNVGTLDERKDFVKTHMSAIDNVVEILLRLTRGDRAGPSHYSSSSGNQQAPQVGALAVTLHAPFPDQQTQVSLAVLAMFRLSMETAQKAGIPSAEIEAQVGEIVRALPSHLLFKAVDGMFRELVKGQKGGRSGKKGRRD
ncbi:hypothetical protein JCM10450v2_004421 [Rhodotorula kratochvilovae]